MGLEVFTSQTVVFKSHATYDEERDSVSVREPKVKLITVSSAAPGTSFSCDGASEDAGRVRPPTPHHEQLACPCRGQRKPQWNCYPTTFQ